MSRSWELFLRDMIEAARKALRFTVGHTLETFVADEMAYDATLRNLEILGEAAKGIPQEIRDTHPEIEWRAIAGLRDVLSHAYFALDDETLWRITQVDLPVVLAALEAIADDTR